MDSIPFDARVGGAPTNVAITCHLLSARVRLMSFVGQDWPGQWLLQQLNSHGLDLTSISQLPGELTPIAVVCPGEHVDDGRFEIHPGWISSSHASFERFTAEVRMHQYLYFGSCILSNETIASQLLGMVTHASRNGCLSILDANIRLALWVNRTEARDRIRSFLPWVRILKMNAEEAALLFGSGTASQHTRRAREAGVPSVIITNGASPIIYSVGGLEGEMHLPEVHRLDPIGSGDVFVGAMLSYLMDREHQTGQRPQEDKAILEAVSFAAAVASKSAAFPSATAALTRKGLLTSIRRMMASERSGG